MKSSWGMNFFRMLFASLNYGIYSLIKWVMQGVFDIAGLNATVGLIDDVRMRIYVFLGIFMFFKLALNLLKYIVNPDAITDKEKGAGRLISRTVGMLVILMALPTLFGLLGRIQEEMLPMLPKVILGQDTDNTDTIEDNADYMAVACLSAFFRPNPDNGKEPIQSLDEFMDRYKDSTNGYYDYDFNFIWALAAGVVIVIILIAMTIKVAIRFFKMFILEMIAPVPVMSYIDPKSSKDGAFAGWVKQLTSTFLDLFFRIGILYVVLFFIKHLIDGTLIDISHLSTDRQAYLIVFLIIGLLMFAKDAPNFIKDAFGIKHDKDTSGVLAGFAGGLAGAGSGFVSGAISGRGIRGAVTGAATGAGAGWQSGTTGKKVSAWRSGGDAAAQAYTGDKNRKSGFVAMIGRGSSNQQMRSMAKSLNLTDDTVEAAKQNMLTKQAISSAAERNFQVGLHTGTYRDLDGNVLHGYTDAHGTFISAREQADGIVADASTAAAKAQKNYEKGSKAYEEAYGQKRTFQKEYQFEQRKLKPAYKARRITKKQYRDERTFNPNKPDPR